MARQGKNAPKDIESYTHADKQRLNNPPVGLVTAWSSWRLPATLNA